VGGLWHDVRYAIRLLKRAPRNTAIAVTILALGIGANTAMFSAIDHVLLRPLPFPDAARLLRVRDAVTSTDGQSHPFNMMSRDVIALRAHDEVFDNLIALGGASMTLLGADRPERVSVVLQSDGAEATLGVRPVVGRGFTAEEQRRGLSSGVAIVSDSLWRTHFGGSPSALGATFRLDDRSYTLIGVMPPQYAFPYHAQFWLPATLDPADRSQDFAVFGHMRPGFTVQQVRTALQSVASDMRRQYPQLQAGFGFEVMTIRQNLVGNQDGTLRALTMIVTFLLLTACINVATLMLARSVTRRREFAVRALLGASRARHLRQLLAESLVLAAIGCGAGLLLAEWLSVFTATLIPSVLSEQLGLATLRTDWHVALFAASASALSAVVAAVIPAFGSWNAYPLAALADGGRAMTAGPSGRRLLGTLIVAETAVTLVLLAGAGLMIQNFLRLRSLDLGFTPQGLLTLEITPSIAYPSPAARSQLIRRIVEEARAASGVADAGVTTVNPLGGGTWGSPVIPEDAAAGDPNAVFTVNYRLITPRLLETMGIPLVQGRAFGDQDREDSVPVAIVSAQMARRFWPNEEALGKRLRLARAGTPWVTIVGVAGNVSDAHDPGVPVETWYLPFAQQAASPAAEHVYVMARGGGDPLALVSPIERAIWRVDKTLAPYNVSAMDRYYAESIGRERLGAGFMLALAAFGLLLSALGVYGVMAFSVAQRIPEIGIRMALGGQPGDILPLVLQRGMGQICAGIGLGVAAAAVLNRVLTSILTEIGPLDSPVLAGAAGLIFAVAMVASVVPALRAAHLDPVAALKSD
jgi:putative ABC transport system permease protein